MDINHSNAIRSEKVCDFFSTDTKKWDVSKVKNIFSVADAGAILVIRILYFA